MVASIAASAFLPASPSSVASLKASRAIGEGPQCLNVRGIVAKPGVPCGAMQVKTNAQSVSKINGAKIAQDGFAFRQNFSIRSYEIGADRTASIEALMNHLQESAINQSKAIGLMYDGFGTTYEMSKRNLIWVVTKMQVFVEKYPSWGDVVQVETWFGSSGKNGVHHDWHVVDYQTSETVVRATSVFVMMNKNTRKLSKMPDEVRAEIGPYFLERNALVDEDSKKLPKLVDDTAQYVQKGIAPCWWDLDVNQHVNNVKYIGWILEGVPISLVESHELTAMILEYRRECARDSVLQSLASVSECVDGPSSCRMEVVHLLRLESGDEVMRARTKWRPKLGHGNGCGHKGTLLPRALEEH